MAALVSNISGGDDISLMMLARGGGMSFDISMIRSYLASLLSPGESPRRDLLIRIASNS
jgi:hypothetical protein